jgi:hypothetical protein
MSVCGQCGKPFVAREKPDADNPTATWRAERCPDCAPYKFGKPEVTLDCCQYIRPARLTARLRDGYNILAGRTE